MTLSAPEQLTGTHELACFDSGALALDEWLRNHALQGQPSGSTGVVCGFYALSAGSVRPEHAPTRVSNGQAAYDLPLVVLTRLGIDRSVQGRGLGAALLKDVLVRVSAAADIVGVRALHAHAKDERARGFYQHFGFEPSPLDPHSMFLLMKDLLRAIT